VTGSDEDPLGGRMVHTGYWRSFVLYTCVPFHPLKEPVQLVRCDPDVQILPKVKDGCRGGNRLQPGK
jgi:hypothetical protein